MRILIFNWKDVKNPLAGGAEIYTHEIAKRLVLKGHEVTMFTSHFKNAPYEDEIDGIRVFRGGKIIGAFDTVYDRARKFYREHRGEFDVVIDECNTRPFLTPKYVKEPILFFIHQLAVEFWDYKTPFPVNIVGKHLLEPYWLKHYRGIPTITVCPSSKKDLLNLGFSNVKIVYNGLDTKKPYKPRKKFDEFTALYVARLTPTKLPEHAIRAFLHFREEHGAGRLIVVGRGELYETLKREYESNFVEFTGFVEENKKLELMARSHVVLVPALREGWGRVVIEANALGTPAIGYAVNGLVDSIRHGYNGLLSEPNPKAMARAIGELYTNPALRTRLSKNAIEWAGRFRWDESARRFEEILVEVAGYG